LSSLLAKDLGRPRLTANGDLAAGGPGRAGLKPEYIHGTLANNPVDLGDLKLDDRVEVQLKYLNDWAFMPHGFVPIRGQTASWGLFPLSGTAIKQTLLIRPRHLQTQHDFIQGFQGRPARSVSQD
jgi:hypothetical protein